MNIDRMKWFPPPPHPSLFAGEDLLGDAEDSAQFTVSEEAEEADLDPAAVGNRERAMYERLCRGEEPPMDEGYRARLGCRLHRGHHPYLLLGPHKEETVFLRPRIVVYHDVLSDEDIRVIKGIATPRVSRWDRRPRQENGPPPTPP